MKLSANDNQFARLKRLSPEARSEIFAMAFPEGASPALSNAEIRKVIFQRWNIRLGHDSQLSRFWPWQRRQAAWDSLSERMSDREKALQDKYPNLSRDEIRDMVIKDAYAEAHATGDTLLGLKVVAADLKDSHERRDWEKLWEARKSKIELGLDELAVLLKKHPDLLEEYQDWRRKFSQRIETN